MQEITCANVGLVSYVFRPFDVYNEAFTSSTFYINTIWVFDDILVFDTGRVCIPCKHLHT